jgi:hypothetical protein
MQIRKGSKDGTVHEERGRQRPESQQKRKRKEFVASDCFPHSMCRIVGRLDAHGNLAEPAAPKT